MDQTGEFTKCVGCGDSHADWLLPACLHPLCQRCELDSNHPQTGTGRVCPSCSAVSTAELCENFILPLAGPRPRRLCQSATCEHHKDTDERQSHASFYCRGCRLWICRQFKDAHIFLDQVRSHKDFIPVERPSSVAGGDAAAAVAAAAAAAAAVPTCRQHGARHPLRQLCQQCGRLLCDACCAEAGGGGHDPAHAASVVPLDSTIAAQSLTSRLENLARALERQVAQLAVGCDQARAAAVALDDNIRSSTESWVRMKDTMADEGLKSSAELRVKLHQIFADRQRQLRDSVVQLSATGWRSARLADLMSAVLLERSRRPEVSAEAACLAMRYCLKDILPPPPEAAAAGAEDAANGATGAGTVKSPADLGDLVLRFDLQAAKAELRSWASITAYDVGLDNVLETNPAESQTKTQSSNASTATTSASCAVCSGAGGDQFQCGSCGLCMHRACHPHPAPPPSDCSSASVCAICNDSPDPAAKARRAVLWVLVSKPHPSLTAIAAKAAGRPAVDLGRLIGDLRAALSALPEVDPFGSIAFLFVCLENAGA